MRQVLVACEESQAVTIELRKRGIEAYSCDIIKCSGGHPEWHIMQDVLPLLNGRCEFKTMDGSEHRVDGKWDAIIAFPPCTYMSKASACRMYKKAGMIDARRFEAAMQAKEFFMEILNADCEKIGIENPTPLKIVGLPKPSQVIQPYQFGHPYSKRTLLWLKGFEPLEHTVVVGTYTPFIPSNTGGLSRGMGGAKGVAVEQKIRSKTFPGIARAMAEQWFEEEL